MRKPIGVVAAGHAVTVEAADEVLRAGGNAYDAVLAGLLAACVAEPVLATPGGGGFLLARPAAGRARLYDFFVQTPARRLPQDDIEFRPIMADFGTVQQEFHIGRGTVAVPGVVKGLFEVHRDLGRTPIIELIEPARQHAKSGVPITAYQAYLFEVVKATFGATRETRAIFGSQRAADALVGEGETLRQPELADALEVLAIEGSDLFYRGEMAAALVADMADGGQITAADLASYEVTMRKPLGIDYHGARIYTNPPPSSGGLLVAFGLKLLESMDAGRRVVTDPDQVALVASVIDHTGEARVAAAARGNLDESMLDPALVSSYRDRVAGRPAARRGTTHLSVIDAAGNLASLTVSNGEGSGYVIPGTGIVMNNMLGEEDLNPGGFQRWTTETRMTSMMAPSAVEWPDGRLIAVGSGGSNRLRSAILQMIINLVDHVLPLDEAVRAPRVHVESGLLSLEGGFDVEEMHAVLDGFPRHQLWDERNMFFGGAHCAEISPRGMVGAGDPRRGGESRVAVA